MRVSLLQLCLAFAAVCLVLGEEVAEPQSRSFLKKLLSPVGSVYKKTKSGLGKLRQSLLCGRKRAVREANVNGKNPLGEGVGAVMDVLDELVADGEAAAGKAAKGVEEVADKTTASVKGVMAASEEKLTAASEEVESAVGDVEKRSATEEEAVEDGINELGEQVEESASEVQEVVEEQATKAAEAAETLSESVEEL